VKLVSYMVESAKKQMREGTLRTTPYTIAYLQGMEGVLAHLRSALEEERCCAR
jgi:hypothetical protein